MNSDRSFDEYLDSHDSLTYRNTGTSMMPLLKEGRDLFTVTGKGESRFRRGDVVLYRRGEEYVLHRVIRVREHDYVILGDNCIRKETGITDADIIGVMTGFVHRGREHTVKEAGYRLYSGLWMGIAPMRILLQKVVHRIHLWVREK